jgi:hypothetical protein
MKGSAKMESSIKNFKWSMVWVFVFLFSSVVNAASDPTIIEAAKKEGQLTLWTSSDLRTASRLVERFEQKYPFLKVKIFRTGTGALHNKMITEALAGQQNWDVMNSQMFTRDLIKRKLLARYKSPEADKLLDANFRDEAGHWTAIYAIPFVLGYNTNLVKPAEVPKSYEELLSARWKGNNISIDQDGYELLQGLVLSWGKEKALGFLKKPWRHRIRLRGGGIRCACSWLSPASTRCLLQWPVPCNSPGAKAPPSSGFRWNRFQSAFTPSLWPSARRIPTRQNCTLTLFCHAKVRRLSAVCKGFRCAKTSRPIRQT